MSKTTGIGQQSTSGKPRQQLTLIVLLAFAAALAGRTAAAQDAERSGKEVVEAVCASCHATGEHGAPTIGDKKAWAKRTSRGLTGLTKSALKGVRQMPPHAANFKLTDTEIKRGITYMVNQSGGHWTEPISKTTPAAERSGEQIVKVQCVKCHEDGVGGAPRIGDRAAWRARVKQGLDVVVRSAINGHGGMPARGGLANLTDPELRAAIVYMMNRDSASGNKP
jgi:cytochrome c5